MVKFIPIMVVAGRTQANSIAVFLLDSVLVWSLLCWLNTIIPFYVPLVITITTCTIYARVGYKVFFKPLTFMKTRSFMSMLKTNSSTQLHISWWAGEPIFHFSPKPPASILFTFSPVSYTCFG